MPVRFRLAEHLAGDRGDFALAEEEEAQEVGEGGALGPLEVDVRDAVGCVADVAEEGGQGIGKGGRFQGQAR